MADSIQQENLILKSEDVEIEGKTSKEEMKVEVIKKEIVKEETLQSKEPVSKEKTGKPKKTLRGSLAAKIIVLFLVIFSFVTAVGSAIGIGLAVNDNLYVLEHNKVMTNVLRREARGIAETANQFFQVDKTESILNYLKDTNAQVAFIPKDYQYDDYKAPVLWKSYEESGFYSNLYCDFDFWYSKPQQVICRVFFDPEFPKGGYDKITYQVYHYLYEYRYVMIGVLAVSVIVFLNGIIFLFAAAGHRNGREGIVPGLLTPVPFDLLSAAFVSVLVILAAFEYAICPWFGHDEYTIVCIVVAAILGLIWFYDLILRVKIGGLFKNTLIWKCIKLLGKGLKAAFGLILRMKGTSPQIICGFVILCLAEVISFGILNGEFVPGAVLWILLKCGEALIICYAVTQYKILLAASSAIAAGQENATVDTTKMYMAFKEMGDNLNNINAGIGLALEQRMKSERMKTELISNVSHDIKTPLTSIINYADLLAHVETDNAEITEYAEVLGRQSNRLKKLLEDLVEASKATTGNVDVNLAPVEVGVLLTQAVGEYLLKMQDKSLELITNQPEEEIHIMADGRHLWRVFDNLMNNICKYAQENTRVFLSLEKKDNHVAITFRNISKYLIEVSPEELEERFVRGDKSRHKEGNGLGLSIAKSLTELQNGRFDITIDGDLFKVVLTFPVIE